MHTFVQIADQGSLTKAAEVLDSSLPAVVRSLAALEAHLGVRLFHRTTRRISLTEEGRRYLASARQVLAAAEAADQELTAGAAEPTGHLSVTAPVLFGHMHVAPAALRFLRRHARMHLSLLLHDRVVNLLEEGIDLAVRIGPLDDSSLVAQPLGSVRRVVVASPEWLRMNGRPRHPRELARLNCVRESATAGHWTFRDNGRPLTVRVEGNIEFNHVAPAIQTCVEGFGCGMFLSYQVQPLVAEGRLEILLAEFEAPPRPVNLVYPHARLLPARTRVFIDWLKQELGGRRF